MANVYSRATRNYYMSRICSGDTKPEMLVRNYLYSKCYRYTLHDKMLLENPVIVLNSIACKTTGAVMAV